MASNTVERNEISRHEILVYQTLARGEWISSREIAEQSGVAHRTARAHALKLVRLGLVEQVEVFPGHRYRLSEHAAQRNRGYSDRITRAAAVLGMTELQGGEAS
jgi:DNA-binding IclR family transcriptional regulator